jgi:hypothetical protein
MFCPSGAIVIISGKLPLVSCLQVMHLPHPSPVSSEAQLTALVRARAVVFNQPPYPVKRYAWVSVTP